MTAQILAAAKNDHLYIPPLSDAVLRNFVLKYLHCFHPDASAGASTVAIDNKIEQAMDLVKSHLMYTVRAEVEVLKERIAELLDRINQLEVENNFLRANASPDVLTALNNGAAQNRDGPTPGCSGQKQ